LGYGIAHYAQFYNLKYVLILGGVTTGRCGEIILGKAEEVLREEFPEIESSLSIVLPDESNRRIGQAIAAASLPRIRRDNQ
jgi:hypothetical protein